MGGDFKITRNITECNEPRRLPKLSHLFNAVVEHWELQEIEGDGRLFTWSNNQEDPIMPRLDRILMSVAFGN